MERSLDVKNRQSPSGLASCPFKILLQPVDLARFRVDPLHEFRGRLDFFLPLGLGPRSDHDRSLQVFYVP